MSARQTLLARIRKGEQTIIDLQDELTVIDYMLRKAASPEDKEALSKRYLKTYGQVKLYRIALSDLRLQFDLLEAESRRFDREDKEERRFLSIYLQRTQDRID